jgi:putative ATPase
MRPQTLDEIVGQPQLLKPRSPLRQLIEGKPGDPHPPAVLFWGPPGSGKTTLAYLIGKRPDRKFVEISATSSNVKELRDILAQAKHDREFDEIETVLFIDEVHRFNKAQQDILLPGVENATVIMVAATTENPAFSVITPLLSRSILLRLFPINADDIKQLLQRALIDERGLAGSVTADNEVLDLMVDLSNGDARKALTILEVAAAAGKKKITREIVRDVLSEAFLRYDRDGDEHYDIASAFIKSMRGSDVDAALHYLARMISGGEDPRFIARRIMIAASEEVAMADPTALQVAVAAAQATEMVGLPEARIILAQAVVHVATAPKSNASYLGIERALHDVEQGNIGAVPIHLRDTHYQAAKKYYGHGIEYKYAHDFDYAIANQQYLPDDLKDTQYYFPNQRGYEQVVKQRLVEIKKRLGKPPAA